MAIHTIDSCHDYLMTDTSIADQSATIDFFLARSGRDHLPLHRHFVQQRDDNNRPRPGPLATFVSRGREPALDQYLLAHSIASAADVDTGEFDVRLHAAVWARARGAYFDPVTGKVDQAALHAVSRDWRFLRDVTNLVATQRVQRLVRVTLRADDGSGARYAHVGVGRRGKQLDDGDSGYLKLPYAYWRAGHHNDLDLAAKAMLLVALSLGDGFPMPANKGPEWYGLSSATVERGLRELRNRGLIHRERHRRPEAASPVGFVDVNYYELLPPFGPQGFNASSRHVLFQGPGVTR